MWESIKRGPLGRISMRKYLGFVPALLVACFLYIIATAPLAHAADTATFDGDTLSYQNHDYSGPTKAIDDDKTSLPTGTQYYSYFEPADPTAGKPAKAYLIYFPPGSTPNKEARASLRTYDYSNVAGLSNPSSPTTITVKASAAASNDENASEGTTSCAVEGIGWIVCPITNFLAKGMDTIYSLVDGFLEVRPLQTTQNQALYRAWSVMRNFANVAFIIGFLIVIYSQMTSFGMSNYGIKKLLPRIVVAAILVNTSYWICAVSIDVFNVLGYSLQDLFIGMRNSLVGDEGNSWHVVSWESMSALILSGGSIAAAGGIGAYLGIAAIGGVAGVAGLIFLLLPILISVLFVVLMTFLILAARQAIITVLVIIAPLAFVAYLLPNTEKWFEKWRSTFFTLLMVFPGFSLIFGGSQLAAAAIIQNANSINIILLGMAVQVMPLAITPILLRLGGGVLNRFAGIVNNPTKGMFDRSKAWSKERLEANQAAKMKRMARDPAAVRRFTPSSAAYRRDQGRRTREGWKAANEASTGAYFSQTGSGQKIHQENQRGELEKRYGTSTAQRTWENSVRTSPYLRNRSIDAHAAQAEADLHKSEVAGAAEQHWQQQVYNSPALRTIQQDAHTSSETAKTYKDAVEAASEAHWQQHATTNAGIREVKLEHHVSTQNAELAKKQWEAEIKEWASGQRPPTPFAPGSAMFTLITETQGVERAVAVEGMRKQQAERAVQIDLATELKNDPALLALAGGVMGEQGRNSVFASAKSIVGKAFMEDIQNIENTMDYGLATNIDRLEQEFDHAMTMAQRIAYANALAKNGPFGVGKLAKVLEGYENSPGTSADDLQTFKEILGTNGAIRQAGKHFDDWINNRAHLAPPGAPRVAMKFNEISEDITTWSNLAVDKFANMNTFVQLHAIDKLTDPTTGNPAAYTKLVEDLRNSPSARALVKPDVLSRMGII